MFTVARGSGAKAAKVAACCLLLLGAVQAWWPGPGDNWA
jgi:hypothetical protein